MLNTWLAEHHLTPILHALTGFGHGAMVLLSIGILVLCQPRARRARAVLFALSAALTSSLLLHGIKRVVDRPRPRMAIDASIQFYVGAPELTRHSFPSGHAQSAATAAVIAAFALPRATWAFCLLAFLVGLSRVALGVHYPSDVLAGWLVGALPPMLLVLYAARYSPPRGLHPV